MKAKLNDLYQIFQVFLVEFLEVSGGFGGPGPLQEAGGEVGEEAGAIPVQIGRNGVEIWPKNRKLTIKKATTICM